MIRACASCEWARDELRELDLLACREAPEPVPVKPAHWCGRFRLAERVIRGEAPLNPAEVLEQFRRSEPQP